MLYGDIEMKFKGVMWFATKVKCSFRISVYVYRETEYISNTKKKAYVIFLCM